MNEQPKFDVFMAHNSKDKPQVLHIAEKLRQRGLKPWVDIEEIPPGESFQRAIQQAIPTVKSAAIFVGLEGT
jgi:histidyl-tRNA synthetase